MNSSLNELFNRYKSDKGTLQKVRHNYAPVYTTLLEPLREQEFKLLEIGIAHGASVDCWLEYLNKASIYAIDRKQQPTHDRFEGNPRVHLYYGEATDASLVDQSGFRIIIDDADHGLDTQVNLLRTYWNRLNTGGHYVIEDLFVGKLPWGAIASHPKHLSFLWYRGFSNAGQKKHFPKHPQDIAFLNRRSLPDDISELLDRNEHFFTITGIGPNGCLHMMLVIHKTED
jgi:hypothetical protein